MRQSIKRIYAVLICALLSLSLAACEAEEPVEEVRVPDFEALGIDAIPVSQAIETGRAYAYETVTEKDDALATHADVTVTLEKAKTPKGFEEEEGYVWVTLRLRMAYGDEASNEAGYRYSYLMADWYDIEAVRASVQYDADRQCETFEVKMDGQTYPCAAILSKKAEDWQMDESTGLQHCAETVSWTLKLPEGYDGIVCGLVDPLLKAPETVINEEGQEEPSDGEVFPALYDPAKFLLFRLDRVE